MSSRMASGPHKMGQLQARSADTIIFITTHLFTKTYHLSINHDLYHAIDTFTCSVDFIFDGSSSEN